MTNDIYIPNELSDNFRRLLKENRQQITQAMESLEQDALAHSTFVSKGIVAKGDLREARAGNLRILFQYTPENHAIIITDVAPASHESLAALQATA